MAHVFSHNVDGSMLATHSIQLD